jgi:hypothetical protein
MDGGNEPRVGIEFCFKSGLYARETLDFVQKAYVNEALNRTNVFRWYSQFQDGREMVKSDESCGRRKSTRTEVNIAAVADMVQKDRRIAPRVISESLNIVKTVVIRILKEDLGKRKTYFGINIPKHVNGFQDKTRLLYISQQWTRVTYRENDVDIIYFNSSCKKWFNNWTVCLLYWCIYGLL